MQIKTERLQLEELNESHFEDLADLLANEEVHKLFPKTLNRSEAWQFYKTIQNKYSHDGHSFLAVIRKEDNRFLGICGILNQQVHGKVEPEIGYRILDTYWGNGYGSEAAKGCMDYARDVLGYPSIISLILPINRQSIRVAEKNGLTIDGETIHDNMRHLIYRKTF